MHIRRAAVQATSEPDTPSSSLALLPLFSISVLVVILLFLSFRLFRRSLHLPSLTWLRGKGQGAKSRLGFSNVELLPTSMKSVSDRSASPYTASFNLESNTGKDRSLLSRTSSLDGLPELVTKAYSPPLGHTRRSKSRSHFKLPTFLRPSNKSLHRRSKSLSVPVRNRDLRPPSTSFVTGSSAPSTPSSQPLLIDFSNSSSSTSSDLGAHKFPSGPAPLIPGIPIPASSPTRSSSSKSHIFPASRSSRTWAFDDDDDDDDADVESEAEAIDPLVTAFRRISQPPRPRSQVDPLPHTPPSSSATLIHAQTVPSFAPQRLSTVNPFASFMPSSPVYATQQPLSPSPISISPSPSSDIQLVPIKHTSALSRNSSPSVELVDIHREVDATTDSSALPATLITTSDPLVSLAAGPRNVSLQNSPEKAIADVNLDPFDDVNAITLDSNIVEPHVVPPSPSEHSISTPAGAEKSTTTTAAPDRDVESLFGQSPTLIPALPELVPTTHDSIAPQAEYDTLTPSWQWDDGWGSIPSPEAPQTLSELLVPVPSTEAAARRGVETHFEKEGDLITFDNNHDYSSGGAEADRELGGVTSDVTDPADAWFVEEPTAVWETSWVEEEAKHEPVCEKKLVSELKAMEDEGPVVPSPEQITVVQAELLDSQVSTKPGAQAQVEDEPPYDLQIKLNEANDNHDINDTTLDTIDVTTKTSPVQPLLSTPVTPTSPHHVLPPHTPPPLTITAQLEIYPDPELLPLPDLPLPISPLLVALSPLLAKPNSPTTSLPLAQTPTPPASPPPILHVPARLSSSPLAPAAFVSLPSGDDSENKTSSFEERQDSVDISLSDAGSHVDVVEATHEETQVTNVITADSSIEESQDIQEEQSPPNRPTTPQPVLSTDLPGSFPSAPEQSATPSISLPAPAHLSLLPRVVAPATTKAPSASDAATAPTLSVSSNSQSTAVQHPSSRLRPPRSALDLALAMQMRPGLGAGADPAWMVRFLMALFGWVAMLASGEM